MCFLCLVYEASKMAKGGSVRKITKQARALAARPSKPGEEVFKIGSACACVINFCFHV